MNDKTAPVIGHHDLLKTAALLLMLVDHIGLFFFPEDLTWRAIGRGAAPIWLYLVGYNMKSRIDLSLVAGALVIALFDYLVFSNWLPLNILFSIMLVRVTLPLFPLIMMPLRGFERGMVPGILMLAVTIAIYPAHLVWEYGCFAFLFAGWGWWQRQAEDAGSPYAKARLAYGFWVGVIVVVYLLHYNGLMRPTEQELVVMIATVLAVAMWLRRFHAGALAWQPGGATAKVLHFCGRQTLLLYVTHFLLLGLIAKTGVLKGLL